MAKNAGPTAATYGSLTEAQRKLLDAAEKAMNELPYNPYSHFYVGAAVLTKDGGIIAGANQENASYGLTVCAERTAIWTARNLKHGQLRAIAIIARGEGFGVAEPTAPCGACRQVIKEAADVSGVDIEVIYSNTRKDRVKVATISQLLPDAFGPRDLGTDIEKYRK